MAVTIVQSAQNYSQSGQPMIWTFSSNQTGQANFSYVIEVYIGGNLVYTAKVLPTTGIYAFFDASEVAERYVNVSTIGTGVFGTSTNNEEIYLIVRENYGTPPINQASATTGTINFFKGKSRYSFLASDYIVGLNKEFLTDFKETTLYNFGVQRVSAIANGIEPTAFWVFYNSAGAVLETRSLTTNLAKIIDFRFTQTFLEGLLVTPSNWALTKYVMFYLNDGANNTEQIKINIEHSDCSTFQNEITFLNFLGGFDVYHFTRMKRYSKTSKPNQFKTNEGVLNADGTFTTLDTSGQFNYQITQDETITLQTGWINENDFNILNEQLLTSPFVLLNGKRVAITEATAEEKYRKFDTLFNFTITIKQKSFTSTVV